MFIMNFQFWIRSWPKDIPKLNGFHLLVPLLAPVENFFPMKNCLLPPKQQPFSSSSSLLALISHHLATTILSRMFLDVLSFKVGRAFVAFVSLTRLVLHSFPLKLLRIFMESSSLPSCALRRRHTSVLSLLLTSVAITFLPSALFASCSKNTPSPASLTASFCLII